MSVFSPKNLGKNQKSRRNSQVRSEYTRVPKPGIEPGASAWEAEILPLNHLGSSIRFEFQQYFYTRFLSNSDCLFSSREQVGFRKRRRPFSETLHAHWVLSDELYPRPCGRQSIPRLLGSGFGAGGCGCPSPAAHCSGLVKVNICPTRPFRMV